MSYIFNKPSSPTPPPSPSGVVITYLDTVGAGTHTLNENTQMVELYLFGAGQGGQGGQAFFSGIGGVGGSAGLPGSVVHRSIPVDFFGGAGSNVSYFIGSGGSGSAGASYAGLPDVGDVGEDTSFGYLVAAGGGSALQASFQNTDNVNFLNPSVSDSISIIPARSSSGASVIDSSTATASLDGGSVLAGNATVLYAGGVGNPSITIGAIEPVVAGAIGNSGEDGFDTYFSAGSGSSGGGAGNLATGGFGVAGSWPAGAGSGGGSAYAEDGIIVGGDGGSGADGLIIVIEWLG